MIWEGTRPANSLLLHALLLAWGKPGIETVMKNNLKMAKTFSNLVNDKEGFELYE
jgi:glutamate/tyrosine decarboxylase-like PLP-dependent enzyme